MADTTVISDPEEAVRADAIQTFRVLLPIVAPNICGYEMRALPDLVVTGAQRLRTNHDYLQGLYKESSQVAEDARDEATAMRGTLEQLHDELANFAYYCRSVAEECVGQRRLMWQERTEWAERLATLARDSAAPPSSRASLGTEPNIGENR